MGKPLQRIMVQKLDKLMGELRLSYMTGGSINGTNTLENHSAVSYSIKHTATLSQ